MLPAFFSISLSAQAEYPRAGTQAQAAGRSPRWSPDSACPNFPESSPSGAGHSFRKAKSGPACRWPVTMSRPMEAHTSLRRLCYVRSSTCRLRPRRTRGHKSARSDEGYATCRPETIRACRYGHVVMVMSLTSMLYGLHVQESRSSRP